MADIILWILDQVVSLLHSKTSVSVLVHEAYFLDSSFKSLHFFVKIINTSKNSPVEITHVWVQDNGFDKEILTRPLPKKIEINTTWETWIPKFQIEDKINVYNNFRVMSLTGKVYKSKRNRHVRPVGYIAN